MQYKVSKSAWEAITPLRVLFFWLIIPLIIMIVKAVQNHYDTIEFYEDKIVHKTGVLVKNENERVFPGVLGISVRQSLWGRIFNYGDVIVNAKGKWDITTTFIKDPYGLKKYLQSRTINSKDLNLVDLLDGSPDVM